MPHLRRYSGDMKKGQHNAGGSIRKHLTWYMNVDRREQRKKTRIATFLHPSMRFFFSEHSKLRCPNSQEMIKVGKNDVYDVSFCLLNCGFRLDPGRNCEEFCRKISEITRIQAVSTEFTRNLIEINRLFLQKMSHLRRNQSESKNKLVLFRKMRDSRRHFLKFTQKPCRIFIHLPEHIWIQVDFDSFSCVWSDVHIKSALVSIFWESQSRKAHFAHSVVGHNLVREGSHRNLNSLSCPMPWYSFRISNTVLRRLNLFNG